MFFNFCFFLKLFFISSVVGIINFDYMDRNETQRKLAEMENIFYQKLNNLESHNMLKKLIIYINAKVDATVNEKISEIEDNITNIMITSNMNIEANLENKVTQTSNKLDSMEKKLFNKFRIIAAQAPCMEETLSSNCITPFFFMDSDTLNHATVKRNSTDHLKYFETHVSIQADRYVRFRLSDEDSKSESSVLYFDINIGGDDNQQTKLDIMFDGWKAAAERVHTPNILSRTEFRAFYIKIDDGNLEVGKEGDKSPLLSYHDARLRSVNYFQFYYGGSGKANLRYDCPAPVEELPYKEESFSGNYYYTPYYSIDKENLNHFTQKRNSTGHLTCFETHISIQANTHVRFRLSDKDIESEENVLYYDIHFGGEDNEVVALDIMSNGWENAERVQIPNVLSSTEFRDFYIIINYGHVEVGKEGENSPIFSHYDVRVGLVKYFQLYYGGGNEATIRYDCPAPIKVEKNPLDDLIYDTSIENQTRPMIQTLPEASSEFPYIRVTTTTPSPTTQIDSQVEDHDESAEKSWC